MYLQSDCKIMFCQIVLILSSIGTALCDFMPVADDCRYWGYLKIYGNEGKRHLHCILDQDFQPGLVYVETKLISNGTCPIYNRYAKQIDTTLCNENIGKCPEEIFPSHTGVTYSGCYEAIRKHTHVLPSTRTEDGGSPPNVSIKHTHVIPSTRTEDGSSPPNVSINNSILITLAVLSTELGLILCMHIVVFVLYYKGRPKPYRGATKEENQAMIAVDTQERFVTKEDVKAIIKSDTQDRFVTKEEVEAMIFDGTQDRFVRKKEVQAMIIDDTQDRFVTKKEVEAIIVEGLNVQRRGNFASFSSIDTQEESLTPEDIHSMSPVTHKRNP